jgi:hypothetical protein
MTETKCVVFGEWNDPTTWKILPKNAMLPPKKDSGFFIKNYPNYEECRRWALRELIDRRKSLGKSMEVWLQRKHINP